MRITVAGDVATSDIWGLNDIVCEKLAPSSEHVGGCRVFLHPPTVSHRQRNLALRRKRPLGTGATRRLTPVAIVSRSQTLNQIQFTENKDPMLEKSVFYEDPSGSIFFIMSLRFLWSPFGRPPQKLQESFEEGGSNFAKKCHFLSMGPANKKFPEISLPPLFYLSSNSMAFFIYGSCN